MQTDKTTMFSKLDWRNDYVIMGFFAVFIIALHLLSIKGFGYFRDEFYYFSCSDHLSLGYVDHPSLSILLLKVIRIVLGDSLIALRILPAIASGVFVIIAGWMAKEFGGSKFAIALASVCAAAPIGNLFIFNIYSMNFLDYLFWSALLVIIIRIVKTGNPKYWLWFGLTAGIGFENKISVLFLCFGIALGILLTKHREHLKSKYLWLGAGIAVLFMLPYVIWNIANGLPTLEFMDNAQKYKMAVVSPLGFFLKQVLTNHPVIFPVWAFGLWYFFFDKEGKRYRLLGWAYLSIYILFTIQMAKEYYLGGIYPVLIAGGAIYIERIFIKKQWNRPRPILIAYILLNILLLCPLALPILPVDTTAKVVRAFGMTDYSSEKHDIGLLPQHFADMNGWEDMVRKVAAAYTSLSPKEQESCIIYVERDYGVAGAINFFRKKYRLPQAYTGQNSFYFWPPKEFTQKTLIIVGGEIEDHKKAFNSVVEFDRTNNPYARPDENHKPIFIGRGLLVSLEEIWPSTRIFI